MKALHKQIMEGRHRFKKHVEKCFSDLLDYIESNPTRIDWLTDLGAEDVSDEYLSLVEKGFRAYAPHIFAMGLNVLKTRATWEKVAKWRKREAYISMARYVLQRDNYRQWNCFSWADFQEREMMTRTFEVRH